MQMSILTKKRTTQGYLEKLNTLPQNTRENTQATINGFSKFVKEIHDSSLDQVCSDLIAIKKTKGDEEFEDVLYDLLQEWIDWNITRKIGAYTIRIRFSIIRGFLYHMGVKTNSQDIKQILKFPRKIQEEKIPITKEKLKNIVLAQSRNPKRQAFYLACSSSGMRMGEALQIKKSDLDFSLARIMIRIKGEYTKTKIARTTFVSKECEAKMKTYLQELNDNDLVFTNSKLPSRTRNEQMALSSTLEALGYNEKYSSNGIYKITTHSFRSYFFTKATRKHNENYAHKLTGHGGYLMQYDRMTDEEKLEMYLELESELVIFDQTKNEIEIDKLKNENKTNEKVRQEVNELREIIARQDKRILEIFREKGNLPFVEK
jgi:integrase